MSRTPLRRPSALLLSALLGLGAVPFFPSSAAAEAEVTSVTPNSGTNTGVAQINVNGSGFYPLTDTVRLEKVTAPTNTINCTLEDGPPPPSTQTKLVVNCDLAAQTPGLYDVVVTHPVAVPPEEPDRLTGLDSNGQWRGFTIFGTGVTIGGFNPPQRGQGTTTTGSTLAGTGFSKGMVIEFYIDDDDDATDPGVTLTSTTTTSTSVTGTLNITPTAQVGLHDVRVRTADNVTANRDNVLNVTAAPVVTNVEPKVNNQSGVGQGAALKLVTINGSGFQDGITVTENPDNAGVTLGTVTRINSDQLTVQVTVGDSAALGTFTLKLLNPDQGTTNTTLNINAKPVITNATAISKGQGVSNQVITLTGTGFVSEAGKQTFFSVDPATGVTILSQQVDNVPPACVTNCTQASLTVSVANDAPTGSRAIKALNYDGGTSTKAGALNITAKPTVTSVSPSSRPRGFSGNVTVNGTGFSTAGGNPDVTFGDGVTVVSVSNVTANTLTATINVANNAAQGTRNVTVTNKDGGSGTCVACFNVDSLTVSGAQPTGAVNGSVRTITVNGQGFSAAGGAPTVVLIPTGAPAYQPNITGTNVVVDPSGNNLTVTFDITTAAPITYGIRVTNVNGESGACSACFTVANLQPTVTSVTPNKAVQNKENVSLVLAGTNFSNGAVVTFSKAGITVDSVTVNSPTQITVVVDVSPTAATGLGNVTATLADAKTATCTGCFEVTLAPTVSSVNPAAQAQGSSRTVTITGSGFQTGAVVTFGNPGVTAGAATVVNATTISVTVSVTNSAATGPTSVTVTNPDSGTGSCAECLTINTKPGVTSVAPDKGGVGQAVPVTITGTDFATGTPTVTVSGTGVTVSGATRTSATTITATFTISGAAPTGARDVTVTTTDGGTATCTECFTVVSSPTLTSLTPNSAKQGTTTNNVTLTGTGFGPTSSTPTITSNGTGVTFSGGTVVSPTSITGVTVTITPTAATGARDVTVANTDGGTGSCAGCFTVTAGPSISNISPAQAAKGQSGLNITITGEGFSSTSTVTFGAGITVTNTTRTINEAAADTIVATITVAAGATTGTRDVTVTNPGDGSAGGCTACFTVTNPRVLTVEVYDTKNTASTADDTIITTPVSSITYRAKVTAKIGDAASGTDTAYTGTPVLTSNDATLTNKTCTAAVAGVAECTANFGDLGPHTLTATGQGLDGDRIGSTMVNTQPTDLEFTSAPSSGATGDPLSFTFRPVAKTGSSIAGYTATRTLTVTGGGSTPASGSTITCASATCTFQITFSTNGTKTVQVSDSSTPSRNTNLATVNIIAVGLFKPLTPARILETRGSNDLDGYSSMVGKNSTIAVQVSGRGGVPSTGVSAVAVNVTVTQPQGTSYLTLYPSGGNRPFASTINFGKNQTVANLAVVKLAANGKIDVYNALNPTHVLLDVVGYYTTDASGAGGRLVGLNPARVFNGNVTANAVTEVDVTGVGGVPAADVSGVVLGVTGVNPNSTTYLTLYPSDATRPTASNLNIPFTRTVSNLTKVPVGADGKIKVYNFSGTMRVSLDVVGYFTKTSSTNTGRFVSLVPFRLVDTRDGKGGVPVGKLGPGATLNPKISGNNPLSGIPSGNVSSVVVNVTVTGGTAKSFLTLYPGDISKPGTNNVSFDAGQQAANLAVVKLDGTGRIKITNNAGSVHVILDVVGYLTG